MSRPLAPGRLAVPDAVGALQVPGSPQGRAGARAARRVLYAFAGLLAAALVVGVTVPLTRTVALAGHLAPRRTVIVRAAEPGLVHDVLVAAGDRVEPGDLVARLRSPDLDESMRTQPPGAASWPLLTRLAHLDLHAPPWSTPRADGAADPASIFPGGIVLTEHLHQQRGARLDAGDALLQIAVADADGRVPLHVRAWADERAARRLRPGQTARVTVRAVPADQPRQIPGSVRRVSPHPDRSGRWRVEIDLDAPHTRADVQSGLAVEVAVAERRETAFQTALTWAKTRYHQSSNATFALRSGPPMRPRSARCRSTPSRPDTSTSANPSPEPGLPPGHVTHQPGLICHLSTRLAHLRLLDVLSTQSRRFAVNTELNQQTICALANQIPLR